MKMRSENELISLINKIREENNIPALTEDARLDDAAGKHAAYMLQTGTLSHTGRKESSFMKRILDEGYPAKAAAENVAEGAKKPEEVVKLWMNSPPHKANILHPDYRNIGVGLAPFANVGFACPSFWSVSFALAAQTQSAEKTKAPQLSAAEAPEKRLISPENH
ncbi:MAG: CAP domain-containing protein [Sneathiellales bacterium]|nr:CAP domain-containing protein [Sneathiellales bacterium]